MKHFILFLFFCFTIQFCHAQISNITSLPAGKYEAIIKSNQNKWERGDIILLDDNTYKISTSNETGAYKFSVAAQRVFFTSGPLKNLFAKTSTTSQTPVIVLPVAENTQTGLSSEVWCYLKQ